MRRRLIIYMLLIVQTGIFAQSDLCIDGHFLAYDIARTGDMPEALRALLQGRTLTMSSSSLRLQGKRKAWHVSQRQSGYKPISPVAPLLQSIRDQEAPYNDLCPYWTYSDGHVSTERCLSGCVATAIEQVLAYYRYPEVLKDTLHGWETDNYTIPDMLPGTRFDWDHYLLDYRDGWTEVQ